MLDNAERYIEAASERKRAMMPELIILPGAGHFEIVAVDAAEAWQRRAPRRRFNCASELACHSCDDD